jgi:ribosomal protein L24E
MKLACSQCNKTLKTLEQDDLTMLLHSDEGVYFFCSKSCKDAWPSAIITEEELESLKQSSL